MIRLFVWVFVGVFGWVGAGAAQQSEIAWIQIEAHPSLNVAQGRAQEYSESLPDVNGFSLGGTWYGIALGPYLRGDAEEVLRVYRAERQIPGDSFLIDGSQLGRQYWPPGADVLNRGEVSTPPVTATETAPAQPEAAAPALVQVPDETPAEARRSEQLLSGAERRQLQIALQAAGFYQAAIDGAFGAGTRQSMATWQAARGFEATGILTTRQRQDLLDEYNAPLISVGMGQITDPQAGIGVMIPAGEVKFDRYQPPFAHYTSSGELGAQVLLISQPGDKATLYGLFDIMQTLEIVPLNGPRERDGDSFTLVGRSGSIVSHTEARLEDGQIKGFTLVWPAGDEARRERVLAAMQQSFERLPGVLDPAAGDGTAQDIDLVSGLAVRKPRLSRSGFFVDRSGAVVTTSEAVQTCSRITLAGGYEAQVVTQDDGLGVAVLRPVQTLAPMKVAQLATSTPLLRSDVAVSGFSYEGVLGAPTLTFGKLVDIKGLRGETELDRLQMTTLPGDSGGPVLDASGAVLGMLVSPLSDGQRLPKDVSFAADAQAIRNVMDVAGVRAQDSLGGPHLSPDELDRTALGMTVLVSCWAD